MKLNVGVDARAALDRLAGMAEFAGDPREALQEIGDLRLQYQRRYMDSAPWVPLKPDSIRRKRKRGLPARPLLGGRLEKSLTRKAVNYSVRRIDRTSITVGTRDPVAHLHDQGTRGHLPQRRLISISRTEKAAYRLVFVRRLLGARASRIRTARRTLL